MLPAPKMKEMGKSLQRVRMDRHQSLQTIADQAKISATYLQKLERGEVNNPSPRVLARLSEVLDVSYLEMMDLAGYLPAANRDQPADITTEKKPASELHTRRNVEVEAEEYKAVAAFLEYLRSQP